MSTNRDERATVRGHAYLVCNLATSAINIRNIFTFVVVLILLVSTTYPLFIDGVYSFERKVISNAPANATGDLELFKAAMSRRLAELEKTIEETKLTIQAKKIEAKEMVSIPDDLIARIDNMTVEQSTKIMKQNDLAELARNLSVQAEDIVRQRERRSRMVDEDLQYLNSRIDQVMANKVTIGRISELAKRIKYYSSLIVSRNNNVVLPKCPASPSMESIKLTVDEIVNNQRDKLCGKLSPSRIVNNVSIPSLDFALRAAGARVIHDITSPTFVPVTERIDFKLKGFVDYLGLPELVEYVPDFSGQVFFDALGVNYGAGQPEEALSLDTSLGACWAMEGSHGELAIELRDVIAIDSVSIDHIKSSEALTIESAPKDFEVYVKDMENMRVISTGSYKINSSNPVQNFPVRAGSVGKTIVLRILSNHGHPDYTCLYRFRVHGTAVFKR